MATRWIGDGILMEAKTMAGRRRKSATPEGGEPREGGREGEAARSQEGNRCGEGEERPRFEVEPPRRPRCPRCQGERLRVAYTTVFRESGFRRVTADCVDCRAICFWDEDVPTLDSKKIS